MRETDGDAVAMSSVYVDTREGVLAEAGDLLQARDEGKFDFSAVKGGSRRTLQRQSPGAARMAAKSPCSNLWARPLRIWQQR